MCNEVVLLQDKMNKQKGITRQVIMRNTLILEIDFGD
jgi:hypothetical protein